MIQVDNLTKRYGTKTAVDNLTFTVQPGMVTGFLAPNGSGKSTTMRLILGCTPRPTDPRRSTASATRRTGRRSTRSECCSKLAPSIRVAPPLTTCSPRLKRRGFRDQSRIPGDHSRIPGDPRRSVLTDRNS